MDIFFRLLGDADQAVFFGFGLNRGDGLAVGIQQVIHASRLEGEFTDRNPQGGIDVHLVVILNGPARSFQLVIDVLSRKSFGFHLRFTSIPRYQHPTFAAHTRPGPRSP